MSYKNILYSKENLIATITINRPDQLNALNTETIGEIGDAINSTKDDESVRVIIITGAGEKAFVAGADIKEFSSFDDKGGEKLARDGQEKLFTRIEEHNKPVIAAVNGFALGGGCELAMSCHLRVASVNARFGQPEVKLGLIPGYGGTQRMPQIIGKTKAMELLMTADMINGEEAFALGLVNYTVEPSDLNAKCEEIAKKIIAQAPLAISGIIRSVNARYRDGENGFETEIREFGKCFITEDFIEGTTAFKEKRKAEFKGK
jgi:enoyl-CoA hydratase